MGPTMKGECLATYSHPHQFLSCFPSLSFDLPRSLLLPSLVSTSLLCSLPLSLHSFLLCLFSGHSYLFFDSSGPLRGFKRSLHEGGVRTPLLIRWVREELLSILLACLFSSSCAQPGVVQPATVSTQQWSFWDFLQTAVSAQWQVVIRLLRFIFVLAVYLCVIIIIVNRVRH